MESRLLILNPDPVFEDRLLSIIELTEGIESRIVRNVSEAVTTLMAESFDGFVIEGESQFAVDAATVARQHFPSLKLLCVPWERPSDDSISKAQQQQIPLATGAASIKRLRGEVRRFLSGLDANMRASVEGIDPCHSLIGNLNQFSPAEILQLTCIAQQSGRVSFKSGRGNSEIYLRQGEVRHAVYGSLEGESALAEIFRWRQGRFYFEERTISQEQSIDRPLTHLLLDNLQKFDETLEVAAVSPMQ